MAGSYEVIRGGQVIGFLGFIVAMRDWAEKNAETVERFLSLPIDSRRPARTGSHKVAGDEPTSGERQGADTAASGIRGGRPPHLNNENSISWAVRNSSRAGTPSWVLRIARLMAGMTSPGWVTRSPYPPKARAKSA